MVKYLGWVQRSTEKFINKRLEAKEPVKRTFKGELLSWLDAIVFAVVFVLIINQYLFQLFMIPSPSMVETLLIKDRVFVSKTSYGIELYPGGPKVFDKKFPLRDDVIVFYNPEYQSKGPVFDILSQMIYMATFSLINIDVDEAGNMRERLYVKRAALNSGEIGLFENGNLKIRTLDQDNFFDEATFREENNLSVAPHRSLDSSIYKNLDAYGSLLAYQNSNKDSFAPRYLIQRYQELSEYKGSVDYYQVDKTRSLVEKQINPMDKEARFNANKYTKGIYVPENHVLPLGDNRDNSQDGRYFGPVSYKKIIGSVKFRFWPISRMGKVF